MAEEITVEITFMDGKTERLAFTPPEDAQYKRATNIEHLLSSNNLAVAVDDAVVVYPMSNIRSIRMFPVPDNLPSFIVRARKLA